MTTMVPSKILRHLSCIFRCILLSIRELISCGIIPSAKSGRLLPRLTVILSLHVPAHFVFMALSTNHSTNGNNTLHHLSLCFMTINAFLNVCGYTVILLLYRHSIQTIFNRKVPTLRRDIDGFILPEPHPALKSFNTHLSLLRPLQILFRFATAPFRVLPDAIVLGETRCGTTNLCGHLLSVAEESSTIYRDDRKIHRIKCYTPFCPWAVPELDHKESFYFVGHYLGVVDPFFYRMAFPLKITRWWEERVLGNIFFCFDGCAQYLTSPSVPYLIAMAYKNESGTNKCTPPPSLVACVRDPVDQAVSWWTYEQNACSWGESMNLNEWNKCLRSNDYPPKSIGDALKFSQSTFVRTAYADAENLAKTLTTQQTNNLSLRLMKLPNWAITWPGGQLSTIGRSGKYIENIERYNTVFNSMMDQKVQVHTVPIENQSRGVLLKAALRPIIDVCMTRSAYRTGEPAENLMASIDNVLDIVYNETNFKMSRRNSGRSLSNVELEPSSSDIDELVKYFEPYPIRCLIEAEKLK